MDKSIILVHYLNFGNAPRDHVRESLDRYKQFIIPPLDDKGIISIVLPVFNDKTRVECINPQLVSEQEYGEALKIVEEAKNRLEKFLATDKAAS